LAIAVRVNMRVIFMLLLLAASSANFPTPTRANDETPSPGTIVASFSRDPAFCESFIYHRGTTPPSSYDRILEDREGYGDFLLPTQGGKGVPWPEGRIYKIDIDNDGKIDEVLWGHGENHYFSGDYLIILPSDPALAAKVKADADDDADVDIDEAVAWAKSAGLSVYSGDDTPYNRVRYTHFVPVVINGETLLWAYPENSALKPAALLYRSKRRGTMELICEYQRVEDN